MQERLESAAVEVAPVAVVQADWFAAFEERPRLRLLALGEDVKALLTYIEIDAVNGPRLLASEARPTSSESIPVPGFPAF